MTTQTETRSKKPTHAVYILTPKAHSEQSDWIEVGAAWEHADKEGMSLSINMVGAVYLQTKGQGALTVRRNKPQD